MCGVDFELFEADFLFFWLCVFNFLFWLFFFFQQFLDFYCLLLRLYTRLCVELTDCELALNVFFDLALILNLILNLALNNLVLNDLILSFILHLFTEQSSFFLHALLEFISFISHEKPVPDTFVKLGCKTHHRVRLLALQITHVHRRKNIQIPLTTHRITTRTQTLHYFCYQVIPLVLKRRF